MNRREFDKIEKGGRRDMYKEMWLISSCRCRREDVNSSRRGYTGHNRTKISIKTCCCSILKDDFVECTSSRRSFMLSCYCTSIARGARPLCNKGHVNVENGVTSIFERYFMTFISAYTKPFD